MVMTMANKRFGDALRELRNQKGYTQQQVADLLAQVKAAGVQKKRLLTQEEFEKMVDATLD